MQPDRDVKPSNLIEARKALSALDELATKEPQLTGETAQRRLGAALGRMPGDMAGRPPKSESERKGTTLGVRFTVSEVARLDALVQAMEAERPGLSLSRSDAVRAAVQRGIAELEREVAIQRKAKKSKT